MNSVGIRWYYCLCLKTLEVQLPRKREATNMGEAVLAPADQEERACGLRKGLAGALPKVQCKLWVNDLIPIIPMCSFCNTSFGVEKREGLEVPDKEWFYWRHGTSGSTRVWTFYQRQLAVDGSWLKPGDLLDHIPGALGVHGTSPRGGTFGERNRCFIDWYGYPWRNLVLMY